MTQQTFDLNQATIRRSCYTIIEDVQQLNEVSSALCQKLYGHPTHYTAQEYQAMLTPPSSHKPLRWVAELDGKIIGTCTVGLPQEENRDMVTFSIIMHPAYEGRGIEARFAEIALEEGINPSGRSRRIYYGIFMQDESYDDSSHPCNQIAQILGLSPKNTEVTRVAPLPLSDEAVEKVSAKIAQNDALEVLTWQDSFPQEYLSQVATAYRQLELDEPTADVDVEATNFTAERIQEMTEQTRDAGEGILATAAFKGETLVALSVITYPKNTDNISAWQNSTVVMPGYRGKGLSRTLKFTSHQLLPHLAPHIQQIVTMNSLVNPGIITINEELGYRQTWSEVCYQN